TATRTRSPTRPRRRPSRASCWRPATSCWSRARAAWAWKSWRRRSRMGEVLIAGTASLLMCVFLAPKFIEFLRAREFGQQIREEGPQEHHAKAGTPTMGGIIIFTAVTVPFVLLTNWDWRAVGVFGTALACALLGFADDYTKLARRRSLGLRGRTKLIVTILISIGLWLCATQGADLADTVNLRIVDASINLGILYPVFI